MAAALLCRAGASLGGEVVNRRGYAVSPLEAVLQVAAEEPRWRLASLLLEASGTGR